MIMSKKRMSRISMALVLCLTMVFSTQMVFATNGLNGVGDTTTTVTENVTTTTTQGGQTVNQNTNVGSTTTSQPTTQVQQNTTSETVGGNIISNMPGSTQDPKNVEDTANAISGAYAQAGPDAQDMAWANAFIEPIADIMNKVMAVILGVTSLLMMFTTMLDLLYLAFPPVRDYLDGGRQGMSNMMGGGRGMGGRGTGINERE